MPTAQKKEPVKKVAKKPVKKTATSGASTPTHTEESRKRKAPKYQSFKLQKKIPHPKGPLPSAYVLLKKALALCWSVKKTLAGVLTVYALLNFVLVRGLASPLNTSVAKESLEEALGQKLEGINGLSAIFGAIVGSPSSTGTETAQLYQAILFVVVSLTIVWVFRMKGKGKSVTTKEAYYSSLYPLVPFLLVCLVILAQLIPAYIGGFIYTSLVNNGIAATTLESGIGLTIYGALITLSLYMLCSSLFALYVVTLPNILPMQALRTARGLVFSRRFSIFRKLLLVPIVAFLALVIVIVPVIYFLPIAAPWVYTGLSLVAVALFHAYLFTMYKELL